MVCSISKCLYHWHILVMHLVFSSPSFTIRQLAASLDGFGYDGVGYLDFAKGDRTITVTLNPATETVIMVSVVLSDHI